jgi:DNA-binding CsgD family transcriptional regulator
LSPREREILELVAQGLTNAQVARMLWISPGTVRKHLENAYEKLDVHTRTGAVAALFASAPTNAGKAFPQYTPS